MSLRHIFSKNRFTVLWVVMVITITSCNKLVTVNTPYTSISQNDIYTSDETAIGVLTGIYSDLSNYSVFSGAGSISVLSGLSADELTLWSGVTAPNYIAYYKNALSVVNSTQTYGSESWSPIYTFIYRCNAAMDGLNASNNLTPAVKQQLLGEAKFLRALFYFYLVNLYGDVPLALTTNYKVNGVLARSTASSVYQLIISDLTGAQAELSANFVDGTLLTQTSERVRPTTWAASALLSRVYLYTQKWDSSKIESTLLINNSALFSLDTLNGVFLKNSIEAIWELQPVVAGYNTLDAQLFIIPSTGPSDISYGYGNPVYLSQFLLNSFEPLDQRRTYWVDSVAVGDSTYYYPYKYKNSLLNSDLTEYLMVLRLGEQYLIRAEAEAQTNDLVDAAVDLNVIRNRAGLSTVAPTSQMQMSSAIMHERQVEMFTELGNRWFDLKRTGTVDNVMTIVCPKKGNSWQSYQQLYPLPLGDILEDKNLVQNKGY